MSVATASRVVSEADYPVSPATRERVLEAARTLDYVPNELARGMLGRRVPVVGVIVARHHGPVLRRGGPRIEDAAATAGYLVITCSSERDAVRERSYVRLLRGMRAAAVVFAGSGLDDPAGMPRWIATSRRCATRAPRWSTSRRTRVAGRTSRSTTRRDRVDGRGAGRAGPPGDRVPRGPRALFVARERLEGYRRGLAAAGVADDDRLVVHTAFDRDGGALGVDTLLGGGAPFTAIACANDLLALGALSRLEALGIRVPGAVSVAGFDDISIVRR